MSTAQNKKFELELKKLQSKMQHEINNSYSQGTKLGIYYSINMLFFILYDKKSFNTEDLQYIYKEFLFLLQCLSDENREYLKMQDIIDTLKEECNIVISEDCEIR